MLIFSCGSFAFSQSNVVAFEYFIDVDPGVGLATSLPVSPPGLNVDQNYTIPVGAMGLAEGLHRIGIRALDASGEWSMREYRTFNIASSGTLQNPDPPSPIVAAEYFIDTDPGPGNATPLPGFPGTNLTVDFGDIVASSTLAEGLYVLGVRMQDSDGDWGMYEKRTFQVRATGAIQLPDPPTVISEMEYFIDVDPGAGNGTAFPAFSGGTLTIDFSDIASANSLSDGIHIIGIRGKEAGGSWGMYEKRTFVVRPVNVGGAGTTSKIVALEYFFGDQDPGNGNGTEVVISPSQDNIDLNLDWTTQVNIPVGTNKVSVRAKNDLGLWGFTETREFEVTDNCTFPNAQFDVQLGCATDAVQFIDTSFDIIPTESPEYRWYLNGDNQVDDATVGDVSWTYDIPGTYEVSLAIYQGQTCSDSVGTTITIKPKPLVAFSTSNAFEGELTNFTVVQVNVDGTMTWSWDFDNDGIEDDNTAGNTTFVFNNAGTYPVTLTVTDPQGCGTVFQQDVVIALPPGGSGGSTPSANFASATECLGSTSNFLDLSENIPDGSMYSWDFDGDGIEDDNTVGNTSYQYLTAGSYTARLEITLPDNSIVSRNGTVTVKPIPLVDFALSDACTSDQIDMTDATTNVLTGATYSWDFNGDGTIDDNTVGDVSTTFDDANTYTVLLLVNNGDGCFGTKTRQIKIFDTPNVSFSTSQACFGDEMTFTNESSNVEINAAYSWDIDGDGVEDYNTGGNKNFTYSATGVYDATLTIDNGAGCAATFNKEVSISLRPQAAVEVVAKCFGQTSDIIDNSIDVEADATYSWDLDGDGIEDDVTTGSTTFVYPVFDSYIARLTIDNGDGCTATAEDVVNFVDAAIPVFNVGLISCVDVPLAFNDSSYQKEPGAKYGWDFNGDGKIDEETPGSTSYVYGSPGTYFPRLQIDNGNNCLAEMTVEVEVGARPFVSVNDTLLCVASTVELDAGPGYTGYRWYDAVGNLTNVTAQTNSVDVIGDYVVEVTDAKGCINTDTANVQLKGPPTADFDFTLLYTEFGINVSFINQSSNAEEYEWDFGDGQPVDNEFTSNPDHLYTDFSFFQDSFYEVCLTAKNFCDDVQTCKTLLLSPTGFDDEALAGLIKIYPNPGNGFYKLELLDNGMMGGKLQVMDNSGALVMEEVIASMEPDIDIRNHPKGIYHMRFIKDDSHFTKSLIYK